MDLWYLVSKLRQLVSRCVSEQLMAVNTFSAQGEAVIENDEDLADSPTSVLVDEVSSFLRPLL